MGWTGQSKDGRTTHQVIVEELEGYHADNGYKVIDHSGKYYALQVPRGYTIAVVALTEHNKEHGETWIYTKMVSEDMGPCEKECPTRILNKLTPLDEMDKDFQGYMSYAAEWREACRENAAAKKAQPKIKPGDVVEFPTTGVALTDGRVISAMVFRGGFRFEYGGQIIRMPKNWKRRYAWKVAT